MPGIAHLTNEEAITQLTLRNDLSELEQELLDRLIRATDELNRIENKVSVRYEDAATASVIQP